MLNAERYRKSVFNVPPTRPTQYPAAFAGEWEAKFTYKVRMR
jgi:hypothetical protein